MTDPAERLREMLIEDGWVPGSHAMNLLDEALAQARAAGAAEERERIRAAALVRWEERRGHLTMAGIIAILDAPAEADRCDRIVNNGEGEPTECGRRLPCEYHDR